MNCCHLLPAYLIPAHQWVMLQIGLLWWKILNIFILNNPNLTVTWKNRGNVSRYFRKITTQRSFWSFSQHLINHVSYRTKYHLWFLFVFFFFKIQRHCNEMQVLWEHLVCQNIQKPKYLISWALKRGTLGFLILHIPNSIQQSHCEV